MLLTEIEAATRVKLREIVIDLEALRVRLQAIHDSLPVSPLERLMLLGEENMMSQPRCAPSSNVS